MTRYRLTPAAQRDLSSIWDYTEDRWGSQQAESYTLEIKAAIERVAADQRAAGAAAAHRIGLDRAQHRETLAGLAETKKLHGFTNIATA